MIKAEKLAVQKIDLNIEEITLLSSEEYKRFEDVIPLAGMPWWLRSLDDYDVIHAGAVDTNGGLHNDIVNIVSFCGVRPALKIQIPKSSNLVVGDKIQIAGYGWTVIAPGLILCDEVFGPMPFRQDWKAFDANVYEKSDVKKWLDERATENKLIS